MRKLLALIAAALASCAPAPAYAAEYFVMVDTQGAEMRLYKTPCTNDEAKLVLAAAGLDPTDARRAWLTNGVRKDEGCWVGHDEPSPHVDVAFPGVGGLSIPVEMFKKPDSV